MSNIICMKEWLARKLAKKEKSLNEKISKKMPYTKEEIRAEFSKRIGGMAMLREWYAIFGDESKK